MGARAEGCLTKKHHNHATPSPRPHPRLDKFEGRPSLDRAQNRGPREKKKKKGNKIAPETHHFALGPSSGHPTDRQIRGGVLAPARSERGGAPAVPHAPCPTALRPGPTPTGDRVVPPGVPVGRAGGQGRLGNSPCKACPAPCVLLGEEEKPPPPHQLNERRPAPPNRKADHVPPHLFRVCTRRGQGAAAVRGGWRGRISGRLRPPHHSHARNTLSTLWLH